MRLVSSAQITIEPGKFGDIIGVEGNPLKDIGSLKTVKTVISRGKIIKYQVGR